MQSFLTGSRAYGDPKDCEDSDLDLVLYLSETEREILLKFADIWGNKSGSGGWANSLRFDMLNVIVVSSKKEYDIWWQGTYNLLQLKPVTKLQAIEMFTKLGLPQNPGTVIAGPKKCDCDPNQLLFGGCKCGGV